MKLQPMRYKDFVWPYNPSVYVMNWEKRIIAHEYPEHNGAETEDLAMGPRIITGNGAFFGENAYTLFSQLNKTFFDMKPGELFHPKWQLLKARMTKLRSLEEPTPNYVPYEFEFIEHVDFPVIQVKDSPQPQQQQKQSSPKTYTVKKGDSLWKIAQKFYSNGNEWKKIANANKDKIKDPNLIYPGQTFKIP